MVCSQISFLLSSKNAFLKLSFPILPLSSSYSQILMVVSTVLERNPEINFSKVLKLDEVTGHVHSPSLTLPPSLPPPPHTHSFYHVFQSALTLNTLLLQLLYKF